MKTGSKDPIVVKDESKKKSTCKLKYCKCGCLDLTKNYLEKLYENRL